MKNLPAVGSVAWINGLSMHVLAHANQEGQMVAVCQDGPMVRLATAEAFEVTPPDYKGHANLAEMIKGHVHVWRTGLNMGKDGAESRGDEDDSSWWDHEQQALDDIEAAVKAELA